MGKIIKNKLRKVTDELYATLTRKDNENMVKFLAPEGSLVIAPQTVSKKDFNDFLLKWISCMEKEIKRRKRKQKKLNKR